MHGSRRDGGQPVLLQTPWAGRGAAPARRFCRTGVHRRCAAKGLGAAVPKALGCGTLSEDRWKHWVCTVKSAEGGKDMGSRQSGSAKPPFPGWGVRLHSHPLRWGAPHRPGPCGSGGHLPSTQRGGSLDGEGDIRLHSRTRGLSLRPRPDGPDTRSRTQLPQAASTAPRQLSAPLPRRARFRLALWGCGDRGARAEAVARAGDRPRGPCSPPPPPALPSFPNHLGYRNRVLIKSSQGLYAACGWLYAQFQLESGSSAAPDRSWQGLAGSSASARPPRPQNLKCCSTRLMSRSHGASRGGSRLRCKHMEIVCKSAPRPFVQGVYGT